LCGVKTLKPSKKFLVPLALTWTHAGIFFRLTPWPDVRCERLYGEDWIAVEPSEDALASAEQTFSTRELNAHLEFAPAEVRAFLAPFRFGRVAALIVAARCPSLLVDLAEVPALTPFLAAHRALRGTSDARWAEIAVVHEREGLYGVLRWLGLPDSRQTLAILRNVAAPDIARKLLEPLRSALWEPEAVWQLSHTPVLTDATLGATCHALAA
jgi:hypothetical protein